MNIYSFWSGDTTYFTKFKSLKKAQKIGKSNMKSYIDNCKYLKEKPFLNKTYFIPSEVMKITKEEFCNIIKIDQDTLILDDELFQYYKIIISQTRGFIY